MALLNKSLGMLVLVVLVVVDQKSENKTKQEMNGNC